MASKIPPELHDVIVARAAGGESTRTVAAWLKATHGVSVSHVQVSRILVRHRDERGTVARHVAVSKVEKTLVADLDAYGRRIEKLGDAAEQALDAYKEQPTTAHADALAKLWSPYQRAHESQQKVLGIDAGPDPVLQSIEDLLSRA